MKKPVKRAVLIHSLCGIGKASLTNILPILSILGVEGCPIPSTVLSSHTGGFKDIQRIDTGEFIENSLVSIRENNIDTDLMFIGYLGSITNFKSIKKYIENYKGKVILDPILGDNNSLYTGFTENHVENMKSLINGCYLITPNITEALYLTDTKVDDIKNIDKKTLEKVCFKLRELGAKNIIITSIEKEGEIGACILEEEKFSIKYSLKVEKSYPGTGDIFTGIIAGRILNGDKIGSAVEKAMEFLYNTIKMSSEYEYDTKEGVLLEANLYRLIDNFKIQEKY